MEALEAGAQVYALHEGTWARGAVVRTSGGTADILLASGGRITGVRAVDVAPASRLAPTGVVDMSGLDELHEGALLENVAARYSKGQIYTLCSALLISVNPYTDLGIYGQDAILKYSTSIERGKYSSAPVGGRAQATMMGDAGMGGRRESITDGVLPPHLFGVADVAYTAMAERREPQAVVISGESGAGKTEGTKHLLRYLMARSVLVSGGASSQSGSNVEERILQSNPLLEAFGNAKTHVNDNSSRFGKLFELQYDASGARVIGANIHRYLLETSRVTSQQPGDRNYHIMYQLCRGADDALRQRLELPSDGVDGFVYLSAIPASTVIEGVDDAADFKRVCKAFEALGFEPAEVEHCWSLLGAVMHLGNVKVTGARDKSDSEICRGSMKSLRKAAELLGVPQDLLAEGLTKKKISGGRRESFATVALGVREASDGIHALARALYKRLFDWLVHRINDGFDGGGGAGVRKRANADANRQIAVLDIYGFESVDESTGAQNSFEQLCINYANEALHQQFLQSFFKLELKAFDEEDLPVANISFTDNQACIDLIEKRPKGLLVLLHEECSLPGGKGTDDSYAQKVHEVVAGTKHFAKAHPRMGHRAFVLQHFAADVTYDTTDFIVKNVDVLSSDLVETIVGSEKAFVSMVFKGDEGEAVETKGKRMVTVAARFTKQLASLRTTLSAATLHFVRCIKPNLKRSADSFDHQLVLRQMRYSGIKDLIVVRQQLSVYRVRATYVSIAEVYQGSGCKVTTPAQGKKLVLGLLKMLEIEESEYLLGRTKIFMKSDALQSFLMTRVRACTTISSTYRMHRQRKVYKELLAVQSAAVTRIATRWRGKMQRAKYIKMRDAERERERKEAEVRFRGQAKAAAPPAGTETAGGGAVVGVPPPPPAALVRRLAAATQQSSALLSPLGEVGGAKISQAASGTPPRPKAAAKVISGTLHSAASVSNAVVSGIQSMPHENIKGHRALESTCTSLYASGPRAPNSDSPAAALNNRDVSSARGIAALPSTFNARMAPLGLPVTMNGIERAATRASPLSVPRHGMKPATLEEALDVISALEKEIAVLRHAFAQRAVGREDASKRAFEEAQRRADFWMAEALKNARERAGGRGGVGGTLLATRTGSSLPTTTLAGTPINASRVGSAM